MKNRIITCSNPNGYSVTFQEAQFAPLMLRRVDGIYTVKNKVTISNHAMIDGAQYQGTVRNARNIVLTVADNGYTTKHGDSRSLLNSVFVAGVEGTIRIIDDGIIRVAKYYCESITSTWADLFRTYTISLICPDPFFYGEEADVLRMANYTDLFEFPHEFGDPEELTARSNSKLATIRNDSADDAVGLEIELTALGPVKNPRVTLIDRSEHIQIGGESAPLAMQSGDVLTITTGLGNKHIRLKSGGETKEVNQYLTAESTFIQIHRGENNIGYSADSGVDNLTVTITYQFKYASV